MFDPYNQNVLKGDYPIIGQHTFLDITGQRSLLVRGPPDPDADDAVREHRRGRSSRTSSAGPNQFFNHATSSSLSFDLFHGDAAFKPVDWRVKLTPVFNVNNLTVEELGVVSPDVRQGTSRDRDFWSRCRSAFVEAKLADLSPDYDFVSVRVGIAAVHQRLPRLHLQRHQPRRSASSAPATPTATSSTSPTSASGRRTPTAS